MIPKTDPLFKYGSIFIDFKAVKMLKPDDYSIKAKYFIAMSNGDYNDDKIICFVLNTEMNYSNLEKGCNKFIKKFYLPAETLEFDFQKNHTSIFLDDDRYYILEEILSSEDIKIIGTVDDNLARQIKNCIDFNDIEIEGKELIKNSFI